MISFYLTGDEQRDTIRRALRHWEQETCVEFREFHEDLDDSILNSPQNIILFTNADDR